jgi:3-dehydroquinate dehydratase-1
VRLESIQKITIGEVQIGGPKVLICLPLVAGDLPALLRQAEELTSMNPDLLEWRIDGYADVGIISHSLEALKDLRRRIGTVPLIFTCRISAEGGFCAIDQTHRLKLIKAAAQTGLVEMVDVEMCNASTFITEVKAACNGSGTRLILSYHNFEHTPDEAFIRDKLLKAQEMGADVAKVAVMPDDYGDVLTLLNATYKARTQGLQIPMITMAMAGQGEISRIAGGLFGSDVTFASGKAASAPGQIAIKRLREAMQVVYGDSM